MSENETPGAKFQVFKAGRNATFISSIIFLSGFLIRFYFKNVGFIEPKEFLPFDENLKNIRYLQIVGIVLLLWLLIRFLLSRSPKKSMSSVSLEAVLPFTPFLLLSLLLLGYWFDINYIVYRLIMSFALGISLSWIFMLFHRGDARPIPTGVCWGILIAVTLLYTFVYSYHNIIDYVLGKAATLDFGYMDNLLWNTAHGRFLFSTVKERSFLPEHFSPLIAVFSLPYLTRYGTYINIIITKILAIGVVFPLFLLAKEKIKSNFLAVSLALCILLSRHYQLGIFTDFHPVHLEPILLVFVFYFIERGKWLVYGLFAALLMMCMEDMFLVIIFIGFYITVFKKRRIIGAVTIIAAVIAGILIVQIIMPAFRESHSTTLPFIDRYRWLSDSPSGIIKTIMFQPGSFLKDLFNADRTVVLLSLFVPFLFLPFVGGGVAIVILPTLMIQLLSEFPLQRHMFAHYSLSVLPSIVVAGIYGASNIIENNFRLQKLRSLLSRLGKSKKASFIGCYLLIAGLHLSLFSNHSFVKLIFKRYKPSKFVYAEFLGRMQKEIPTESCVYASDTLYTYFDQRWDIYRFKVSEKQMTEILDTAREKRDQDLYVLIDLDCWYHDKHPMERLPGLLRSGSFSVYDYFTHNLIALKAGHSPGKTEDFADYYWRFFEAEKMMESRGYGDDVMDEDASNGKARFVSRNAEKSRHIVFGPYHIYPQGEYTATFYLKILNAASGEIAFIDAVDAWASKTDKMVILDSRKVDSSHFPDEGEYFPFTLSFSIEKITSLEFRVMFLGNADLYIDKIVVDSPVLVF